MKVGDKVRTSRPVTALNFDTYEPYTVAEVGSEGEVVDILRASNTTCYVVSFNGQGIVYPVSTTQSEIANIDSLEVI